MYITSRFETCTPSVTPKDILPMGLLAFLLHANVPKSNLNRWTIVHDATKTTSSRDMRHGANDVSYKHSAAVLTNSSARRLQTSIKTQSDSDNRARCYKNHKLTRHAPWR